VEGLTPFGSASEPEFQRLALALTSFPHPKFSRSWIVKILNDFILITRKMYRVMVIMLMGLGETLCYNEEEYLKLTNFPNSNYVKKKKKSINCAHLLTFMDLSNGTFIECSEN
jgi:hypothetical protein